MKEIEKLKRKEILSYEELDKIFTGYLNEKVTDKEMTKVLELICENGLSDEEVINLTDIFVKSGEVFPKNTSFIDKHSTGGVGDKTTLIVLPILASLNVKVSKMSGRALGHTGGTIDKLESIGVKTDLTKKEFYDAIEKNNMVIASQTDNLCPLDKKVYALRNLTGTSKSVPLIAVSIMSKKIASGAGKILIDVKVGKGALVSTIKEAERLANLMIKIGKKYNRKVVCMLTRMDNPLGSNIGNSLEVEEAVDILRNNKQNSLRDLVIELATQMYILARNTSKEEAREKVLYSLNTGKGYKYFENYVKNMKGKLNIKEKSFTEVKSLKTGYIKSIDSKILGTYSMMLGAGRTSKKSKIDYNAGIVLEKVVGDHVKKGDTLCKLYGKDIDYSGIYEAYSFGVVKPKSKNIIIKVLE